MSKKLKAVWAHTVIILFAMLSFTTCDVVKAGLGHKIDVNGPEVSVSKVANGDYLRGKVTISGDASDVLDISSVKIIVTNKASGAQLGIIPATLSNGTTWTATLDTMALSGGADTQVQLDIQVSASSGKTSDDYLIVYFDNNKPSLASMTPTEAQLKDSAYNYAMSQQELITGSFTDFGLSTVTLTLGSLAPMAVSTKSAFSFTVNAAQFCDGSPGYAAKNNATRVVTAGASSIYSVPYTLVAADRAGNTTVISDILYVKAGNGEPTITFTNPADASFYRDVYYRNPFTGGAWKTNLASPGSQIMFHAYDMDGLDTSQAGLFVVMVPSSYAISNPGFETVKFTAAGAASLPATGAVYAYVGHGLAMTNATKANITLSDGTTKSITQGADFSFTAPSSAGEYLFFLYAADDGSAKVDKSSVPYTLPSDRNTGSSYSPLSWYLSLYLSDSNPVVTLSSPSDGAYLTSFSAAGTASDGNCIVDVFATIKNQSGTVLTPAGGDPAILSPTPPPYNTTTNWSYSYAPLADGTYTASFIAKNQVAAQTLTPVTRVFTIDTTSPVTAITLPGSYTSSQPQYWLSGATATLSGSASDAGSGVKTVYYATQAKGAAAPSFSLPASAPWTLAAGSSSWNSLVSLGSEGEFTLYVVSVDNVNNVATIAHRDYGVDQSAPTLSETSHAATSFVSSGYTLTGALSDTNALASLSITESKDGGAAAAVSFTPSAPLPGASAPTQSANYTSQALPIGGVADGSYAYVLTATDVAGKTAVVNRTIKIDTTSPTVAIATAINNAWIGSSAYTVSGTGADPNPSSASGVSTIQYQLDALAWTAAAWSDASGGANTAGNWSFTLSGLTEGTHSLKVRATDAAGNVSTLATASFHVDLNAPSLTVAAVPAMVTAATAASFTGFSGTLYDTYPDALPALKVTATQNGSILSTANNATIAYAGSSTASPGNSWSYPFAVDASGHTTDGLWTFAFTVADASGKETTVSKTITIDTTPPTTTVTSPSSGGWSSTTALSVMGVASDGSGTGVSKVYVKVDGLYVASSATDHSAEDPTVVANGWTEASGATSWNASLTLSGEGRKTLWVKAVDAATPTGNMTTAAGAVSSRVDFGLDLSPPSLSETDSTGGTANAPFSLSGKIFDTNSAGLAALSVTSTKNGTIVANNAAVSYPGSSTSSPGNDWSYAVAVDAAGHTNDGQWTFVFTATDIAGKTTNLTKTITIDTTPPTVSITLPGGYTPAQPEYWLSGSTATIKGSSSDAGSWASGVSTIYYKVDPIAVSHAADDPKAAGWTLAAGTAPWSAAISLAAEGQFTLWVAAYDNANNLSAISSRDFGVDQNPPTLTETNHVSAISYTKTSYTLAGDAGDTNALASLTITESKDGGTAQSVTYAPAAVAGQKSVSYSTSSLPLGGVSDGSYAYVLTATDVAGKPTSISRTVNIDTTSPTVAITTSILPWISTDAYAISGTAADPNAGASGVASIQYQLDGGTWTAATWNDSSGGHNTSGTWSFALSGLSEGNHTIKVLATDAAGNNSTLASATFGVDLNAPSLTVSAVPATITAATAASFTGFSGTLYDTNPAGMPTLTVTSTQNGAAVATGAAIAYSGSSRSAPGNSWSYAFAVDASGHTTDGLWSFVFTATDVSGKTASVTKTITIDTTPPTISVASPSAGGWSSTASLSANGTASDGSGSGVSKVYVKVDGLYVASSATDHSAEDPTVVANGWTAATGGTSWSTASTPLSLGSEGRKTLWIKAADAVGNVTTAAAAVSSRIDFGLDLSPPSLSETDSTGGTANAPFSLNGKIFDTNSAGLAALSVTSTRNGSVVANNAAVSYSGSSTSSPGNDWSYAVAVDAAGHGTDGQWTFVFTATDIAGKTTNVTKMITVDTTPPTLAISQPGSYVPAQSQYWLSGSTAIFGGMSADAGASPSGVSKVYYKVDAKGTSHASDDPIAAGWTLATGSTTWSATISLATEGQFALWVAAYDNAGNLSSISSQSYGVDQGAPQLTESSVGTASTVFRNGDVAFSGLASDTNALASSGSLTVSVDGGASTDVSFTTAPNWSYTYSVNKTTHVNDSTHSFVFTATDVAGKTTTVARTVLVDTKPATVAISTPGVSAWTNASSYSVSGTASDDSSGAGVYQVWTLADARGVSHAGDSISTITTGGNWKQATGTTNWSYSWNLGAEGNKTLWAAVLDAAGNWSVSYASVDFGYDGTAPSLAIAAMGGYNAAPTITGTVSDAASGMATLQYKIDSGSFTPIGVAANWSSAIPSATFAALSEGAHTVTVQAIDAAGNQSTQAAAFNKDTTPPTLTYTNISSSGGTLVQNSSPVLTGTLMDLSYIASASYTLQVYNYSTASWNAVATGVSLGTPPSSNTTWTWSLDLGSSGLKLPDGKYQIAVSATDVPGNSISSPAPVMFYLSRTSPGVAIAAPSLGTFQNAGFPLVGTASDPNGIAQVAAKIASGSVSFASGTTSAVPALPATVAVGTPGTFATASPHGLNVNDQVYIWASPMPAAPSGALSATATYYVQSTPTPTSFTISSTSGGAAIAISASTAASALVGIPKDSFSSFHPAIPVTANTGDSTLAAANHGLVNGDIVYFQGTTLPAGTNASTPYYVVNRTAANFQVSASSGGAPVTLGTSGTSVSVWSSTQAVNWMIPAMSVSGLADGAWTAYAQVTAGTASVSQTSRDFTLDTTKPTIALSSPSSGTRSVGNLTIIGTTSDGGSLPSGVTGSIQYQVGKNYSLTNAASWTSANVTGGAYSWTISLGDMSTYASATYATECDSSGTAIDDVTAVVKGGFVSGNTYKITNVGSSPDWSAVGGPATATVGQVFQAVNSGSGLAGTGGTAVRYTNLWNLPIVFQATDVAGNVRQKTDYYLILDPSGNVPVVLITQPATGLTFGGQQRITGTATQPIWVHDVEVSIDPTGGGNFTTWNAATLVTTGNSVIWYYDVNSSGQYPSSGDSQTISVQVRAWNSAVAGGSRGAISGELSTPFIMTFNSTYPQFSGMTVGGSPYYSQIITRGTTTFAGTVSSSKGIAKMQVVEANPLSGSTSIYDTSSSYGATASSNGAYWSATATPPASAASFAYSAGSSTKVMITATGSTPSIWTAAGATATTVGTVFSPSASFDVSSAGGSFIASDASGNFNYAVSLTVDTAKMFSGTSGVYSFTLRATDMTSPVSQVSTQNVTIDADNFYPTATIASSSSITGSQFVIQGSATDSGFNSGAISSFSKVVVYLVRGGSVLNLKTGAAGATSSMTALDAASSSVKPIVYPGSGSGLKMSIDTTGENNSLPTAGGTDANGDGFMECLSINGSSYNWMGQFDSTALSDGSVDVHYVVFDAAGNATHYAQTAFVSNHAPSLSNIVIGTDLTGSGSTNSTATFTSGTCATTGFTIRNNLMSIQVNSSYDGSNGSLIYSLINGGTEYWGATGTTVSGTGTATATLTVDFSLISPAIADASGNGVAFTLKVSDTDTGQSYTQTIGMNVQNADTTPPTISVADFGYAYSSGGADGSKSLVSVSAYGDNLWSGAGHVEYSSSNIEGDNNSAVSGKVVFKGKAYDNQRIACITAIVPGFDGGSGIGAEFPIAIWGGSGLVKYDSANGYWTFAIDGAEYLTQANGHVLNWNFSLDTSQISGGAQLAEKAIFKAYDFGTTGTATRASATTITAGALGGVVVGQQLLVGWSASAATPSRIVTVTSVAGSTLTFTPSVDTSNKKYVILPKSASGTGTRGSTTQITAAGLGAAAVGQSMYLGTAAPTEVTITAVAGTTATFAPAVAVGNTTYVLYSQNAPTTLAFDVVPYITSIARNTSIYNTNRSKYGKYPVFQGEAGVVVSGYNLLSSTTVDASNYVKLYNASGTADSFVPTVTTPLAARTNFAMTINASQRSGWLRVVVNGIASINNMNSNGFSYNKADDGSGLASTKWTDDVYLSVWNVNQWSNGNAFPSSANAQYPTFAADSAGNLYGTWINYAAATVNYAEITGTSGSAGAAAKVFEFYDPPEFVDAALDSSNNLAIAYIQNTFGGSTPWTNLNAGSVNVWASDMNMSANNQLYQATSGQGHNYGWNEYGLITDGLWHNDLLWEHYGVKIVRSGGSLHVVWYDDSSKSVKYAYFASTQNAARGGTTAASYYVQEQPWINIDGGFDAYDIPNTNSFSGGGMGPVTGVGPGTGCVPDGNFTSPLKRISSVGQSVSIDVDKNGYPVIAYYDNVNHVLRTAYASSATPTAVGNWHVQAVHPSGDPLDSFAGANSGDKNGNVTIKINHATGSAYLIAYRPTKGQLVYSTAAARGAGDLAFGACSIMDSSGNVGSWSDISVNTVSDIPTMVYQNKNGLGTNDGVKVAYWDTSLPTPDWETIIAPANTYVDDGKLSIANNNNYASVPWKIAVGFKSSAFQVMYLQPTN